MIYFSVIYNEIFNKILVEFLYVMSLTTFVTAIVESSSEFNFVWKKNNKYVIQFLNSNLFFLKNW